MYVPTYVCARARMYGAVYLVGGGAYNQGKHTCART